MYCNDQNYFDNIENTQVGNETLAHVDYNSTSQPINSKDDELQQNNQNLSKRSKIMFTKEEDKKLIKAVRKFGEHDWKLISSFLENRTGRQCRERWKKFLCPSLNHSPWTNEEDEILLQKYKEFGPKWSQISSYFQNRTDVNIKTRFTVLSRKMKKEQEFVNQAKIFPFQKFLPLAKFNGIMFTPDINGNCLKKSKKFVKKLKNFVQQSNNININQPIGNLDFNSNFKQVQSSNNNLNIQNNIDDEKQNMINSENSIFDVVFSPIQQSIEDDLWNEYNCIDFY